MNRARKHHAVLAATTLLVACAIPSLEEFSGGVGGGGDGGPGVRDAATDAREAGNGPTEAGPGPVDAAGGDALADAGARPFCASLAPAPLFCADFDGTNAPWGWAERVVDFGGVVETDTQRSVSGPASLRSEIPERPAGETSSACVRKAFTGPFRSIHIEADVWVSSLGGENYEFLKLEATSTSNIALQMDGNTVELDQDTRAADGGEVSTYATVAGDIVTGWKHVRWDLAIDGATARSTIQIGDLTTTFSGASSPMASKFDFELGDCNLNEDNGAWRIHFDNVVFDAVR